MAKKPYQQGNNARRRRTRYDHRDADACDYECLKESVLMEAFNSIGMGAGVETMWSYKLKQDQACRSVLTTMGVGKVIDKKLKGQNADCDS